MLSPLYSDAVSYAIALILYHFTDKRTVGAPSVIGIFAFCVAQTLHVAYGLSNAVVATTSYLALAALAFDAVRMVLRRFQPRKGIF